MDLEKGYNVITGESGAGKSIVVNALSLISGARAYKEMIRTGEEKAVVEAVFSINDRHRAVFSDYIDKGEELVVITREVWADKASVCKINGKLRNLSDISQLSGKLIDIHGQYENQSLLNIDNHRHFLDEFASDNIAQIINEYNKMADEYRILVGKILNATGSDEERERSKDILEFQIEEIDKANLTDFDEEEFAKRINILENAENYINGAYKAVEWINGEELSAVDGIREASKVLRNLPENEELNNISSNLDEIYFKLRESLTNIEDFAESVTFSPEEYEQALEMQNNLQKLKRKYGSTVLEILHFRNSAQDKLDSINNYEIEYENYLNRIKNLEKELNEIDENLSIARLKASKELGEKIVDELIDMGMKEAYLITSFKKSPGKNKLGFDYFPKDGRDICEFLITLNKGMVPMSLGKVASGGELSRIMLAFKTVFTGRDETTTVVFDEIDSGISGNASIAVANKIKKLSKDKQVICITHQPQIAAKANTHFVIKKGIESEISTAVIQKITQKDDIIETIASLTDGELITNEGREHAEILYNKNNEL